MERRTTISSIAVIAMFTMYAGSAFSEELILSCGWHPSAYDDSVEVFDFQIDTSAKTLESVNPRVNYDLLIFGEKEITFSSRDASEELVERIRLKNNSSFCKDLVNGNIPSWGDKENQLCFENYQQKIKLKRYFTINRINGEFSYFDKSGEEVISGRMSGECRKMEKLF